MKKIILFIAGMMALSVSSCSDMLEVESDRYLTNPDINQKTDSLFYAWGIMQAMQEAADMYVLQNEMRGELVTPTSEYASEHLKALANYSATTANKYDSAYVYYRVINNCNYYLANRDTTLLDGSYNVTRQEYAAVMTFRAWAYLQLVRQYGNVPFFTEPLNNISQIENNDFPVLGIKDVVERLIPDLEKYTGENVPSYGTIDGTDSKKLYIPVDIMLGELYLELGGSRANYILAAQHYHKYLFNNPITAISQKIRCRFNPFAMLDTSTMPTNFSGGLSNTTGSYSYHGWSEFYVNTGLVTEIRMAYNKQEGRITELPELFGYDLYSIDEVYMRDKFKETGIQLVPSQAYNTYADSSYYYYVKYPTDGLDLSRYRFKGGDQRRWARLMEVSRDAGTQLCFSGLYTSPDIILYKRPTIWLHLAEALNRAGYPDAAFAILKDGISPELAVSGYITPETMTLLQTEVPFLSVAGQEVFQGLEGGIHSYGCSDFKGIEGFYSSYQMYLVVSEKIAELRKTFGLPELMPEYKALDGSSVGYTADLLENEALFNETYSKDEIINAVEDLLCDEYAMESAFEGNRFSDLSRLARRKNASSIEGYPDNFGGLWFANKLVPNNPVKDLTVEANWYLPFK